MAGRSEGKRTRTGRSRQPDLRRYYRHKLPAYNPGRFDIRLSLVRGNAPTLNINPVTEALEWADSGAVLQGTISLRRPDSEKPRSLPVGRGHRIRVRIRWAGDWFKLWEMRCLAPQVDLSGAISVELVDEMDMARRSERDRLYRKDKGHPRGWSADEVTRHAARRDGIRLGRVAKGKVRIKRLRRRRASFLDIVRAAYQEETERTGRRFVFRYRDGLFEAVPYQRNRVSFVFGKDIVSGSVTREGSAKPITALTGVGRVGRGKGGRKIRFTQTNRDVVRRFGYAHRTRNFGKVDSMDQLRAKTKRAYAKGLRVRKTASLTVPFTPFIRRGDAVMLDLPREGFRGDDSFVFATEVRHVIRGADRVTELEVTEVDPFKKYVERREREQRARKRRERKRRKS